MHVSAGADLRCVKDDELMVRIHMDPGNVVTVPALNDRHRMKVELVREQFLRFVTPFRNVEPEKSVGALPQGWQLPQVALVHVFRVDPAQLHDQSPYHICRPIPLTTREGARPFAQSPRPGSLLSCPEAP